MARKALIVYASVTGNTEKVAKRFKQVFDKKGEPWGDWECDIYKITKQSDKKKSPYHLEDYDFICVGAPIWAGIPPLYLFDDHIGALGAVLMPRAAIDMSLGEGQNQQREELMGEMMAKFKAGWGPKKGVAFVTYGGQGQGPIESLAALSCLELRLEGARVKCVGKFACCGGMWDEPPVDRIANRFGWMVGDATVAISRYKENPNDPEFDHLSEEDRKLFDRAAKETQKFKPGRTHQGMRSWHFDYEHRPTERDLLKAEIFLSEILEDYYWGGVEMYPYSQYLCIA